MKAKYLLLLLFTLAITIQSCDEEENNTPQIGVALKQDNNDWIKAVRSYGITSLESYGLSYSIRHSESELRQGSIIADLVRRNTEVMIVSPERLPEDSLLLAHAAGIPVVFMEYPVTDTYAVLVQNDNVRIGETAAEYFNSRDSISKIALISVQQDSVINRARLEGFMAQLDPGIDTVTIKINTYTNTDGARAISTIMINHPDVNAIYAQNDEVAAGIVGGIAAYDNIDVIVGCGGSADFLQRIKNSLNITLATTLYSPKDMIETAIREAHDILTTGIAPDKKIVNLETAIIDSQNVDSYLGNADY